MTEPNVSTAQEPDLQQNSRYTPEQISNFCEKIDNICFSAHSDGELLFNAVEIIRQLQSELAEAGLKEMGFKVT